MVVRSSTSFRFTFGDYLLLAAATLCGVAAVLFLDNPVFADSVGGVQSLTDLFKTETFRGSFTALESAQWIGKFMHYAISWFSFLGLCLTIYQKFITLLYLSARNLFDTVNDIKTQQMKGKAFGITGLVSSLWTNDAQGSAVGGGGFDVFITFIYGLLPNVKAYSDYGKLEGESGGGKSSLQATDGVTQYMLKTAIPTIMLIFFLTIGYSGTLTRIYGEVVDGMATAADKLVTGNLSSYIDKLVGEGGGYTFTLGASGTASGAYAEEVAKSMYVEMMRQHNLDSAEFEQALGRVIENAVAGTGVAATGASTSVLAGGNDEAARENLRILTDATLTETSKQGSGMLTVGEVEGMPNPSIYSNTNSEIINNAGLTWKVSELFAATGVNMELVGQTSERYIHVICNKGAGPSTNYFEIINSDTTEDVFTDIGMLQTE